MAGHEPFDIDCHGEWTRHAENLLVWSRRRCLAGHDFVSISLTASRDSHLVPDPLPTRIPVASYKLSHCDALPFDRLT